MSLKVGGSDILTMQKQIFLRLVASEVEATILTPEEIEKIENETN